MRFLACALASFSALSLAQPADAGAASAPVVLRITAGLEGPASVLHDAHTDTYLVANLGKDAGYITELSADGAVVHARLVQGGVNKATLHAPRGLAVHDGLLYVADLDTVRLFDRSTGAPRGEVRISGATSVRNLVEGPDGKLYLTDSGVDPKLGPTGTDGIYVLEPGKKPILKTLVKGRSLHQPAGLLVTAGRLQVVCAGVGALLTLDLKGKPLGAPVPLPAAGLGEVVAAGDALVISSADGASLFEGASTGPFLPILPGVRAPAGLGYDGTRRRLLLAQPEAGALELIELP